MINLLSFAVFEGKYQPYQLSPLFKKKLDNFILLGSLKNYEILNPTNPSKAELQLTDYRDNVISVYLTYRPEERWKREIVNGRHQSVDYSDPNKPFYAVTWRDKNDEQNYKKYSNFVTNAYDSYLKENQVKKIKVNGVEIEKKDVINHVQELDVFKKIMQDFDLINVTTPGEAKNGTLSFYYKYQGENKSIDIEPYAMWKISGKGGNVYDTRGNGTTVVKFGPMQTLEDYEKALNFLYEYLGRLFSKRVKEFKKNLAEDPSLKQRAPGQYKMMQKIDNPTLFKNDNLRKMINTGLFD